MKRKIITVCLIFMMTFSLFACKSTPIIDNPDGGLVKSGTVNVSLNVGQEERNAIDKVAKAYEAINPLVSVSVATSSDSNAYNEGLSKRLAAQTEAANIVQNNSVGEYYSDDYFVDYAQYLVEENEYSDNKLWKDLLQVPAYRPNASKGQIYSLNFESTQCTFFYNKKIFIDAGLVENGNAKTPKTFDELIEFSKVIKAFGKTPIYMAGNADSFSGGTMGWLFRIYADQYFRDLIKDVAAKEGDYFYDAFKNDEWQYKPYSKDHTGSELEKAMAAGYNDAPETVACNNLRLLDKVVKNQTGFDNDRYKNMLANMLELIPKYTNNNFISANQDYGEFFNGNCAMVFASTDLFKVYQRQMNGVPEDQKIQMGTFYAPPMQTHKSYPNGAPAVDITRTVGGPQGFYGVVNHDKNANALAMDFMKFWTSSQGTKVFFDSISAQGWSISGTPLIKDIEVPGEIHPSKNLPFVGECDLNPINLIARGYGAVASSVTQFQIKAQDLFGNTSSIDNFTRLMQQELNKSMPKYFASVGYRADCLNNLQGNPFAN